jgi:signal transduction histidine kinase
MRETTDEQPFLLATLPPSQGQRRFALAVVAALFAAFVISVPFAFTPLPQVDAFIPTIATAYLINDSIASALLFSQFSIVQQRALLVLAMGYLFSALMVIPYVLTFPGLFAPTGLLGAGSQSTVWIFIISHIASPWSMFFYELLKGTRTGTSLPQGSARTEIGLSVAVVIAAACALTWFVTAQHDLLPNIFLDAIHLSPLAHFAAGFIFLSCTLALALLWIRRSSVLDLWLMVTVCAWLLEITISGLLMTDRFSLGWYMSGVYSLIAGSAVLIVLLSEATTLYAHLARSMIRQRAARQARQFAMDAMAASVAHEVNQPLAAIAANTEAALVFLARTPPNIDEVRAALEAIANDSARGSKVIASLRAMFKKDARGRAWLDANELVREALAMLDLNFRSQGVSVSTALREGLPQLLADRGQLQQVLLNLMMNAVDAMRSITDRARLLRVRSESIQESASVLIAIEDSGTGIDSRDKDRIFEPFFTTKSTGTGIGLAICLSIIESHGGSLRASANNPFGTIFQVVLPIDGGGSA